MTIEIVDCLLILKEVHDQVYQKYHMRKTAMIKLSNYSIEVSALARDCTKHQEPVHQKMGAGLETREC